MLRSSFPNRYVLLCYFVVRPESFKRSKQQLHCCMKSACEHQVSSAAGGIILVSAHIKSFYSGGFATDMFKTFIFSVQGFVRRNILCFRRSLSYTFGRLFSTFFFRLATAVFFMYVRSIICIIVIIYFICIFFSIFF